MGSVGFADAGYWRELDDGGHCQGELLGEKKGQIWSLNLDLNSIELSGHF